MQVGRSFLLLDHCGWVKATLYLDWIVSLLMLVGSKRKVMGVIIVEIVIACQDYIFGDEASNAYCLL